jgi:hypothetical protein
LRSQRFEQFDSGIEVQFGQVCLRQIAVHRSISQLSKLGMGKRKQGQYCDFAGFFPSQPCGSSQLGILQAVGLLAQKAHIMHGIAC